MVVLNNYLLVSPMKSKFGPSGNLHLICGNVATLSNFASQSNLTVLPAVVMISLGSIRNLTLPVIKIKKYYMI